MEQCFWKYQHQYLVEASCLPNCDLPSNCSCPIWLTNQQYQIYLIEFLFVLFFVGLRVALGLLIGRSLVTVLQFELVPPTGLRSYLLPPFPITLRLLVH